MDDPPLDILRRVFGYDDFRGDQRVVIDHVIAGGDAVVLMPTGGGKSLCYQIPSIVRQGVGIIISPLIALMQDQVQALQQFGVKATFINSTLPADEAFRIEQQLRRGEYDMVYVAPERLMTPRFLDLLDQSPLALFAIDEAHCVSQWGHDFRPEYMKLTVLHERYPRVPRIALTATADEPTRRDISARLKFEEARLVISGFDRPNIRYRVELKDQPRQQLLRLIQTEHAGDAGIVYCMTRKRVEQVAAWLVERGIKALPYHAGLNNDVRSHHLRRFLREDGIVVVATIAFGMGIDKPDVRFVAHFDVPRSLEAYYQETGRAGRDGLPATAWMAYGLADIVFQKGMIDRSETPPEQKRIEHRRLNLLVGYCETTACRRQVLLNYFGQTLAAPCGNCDTCLTPPDTFDATTAAQMALSCVYRTGQTFGAAHIIDVLRGQDSDKIARFNHDKVSTFGIGRDIPDRQWHSIIRQLVARGMLAVDHEHGSLKLTPLARPVLRGEERVSMRRDAPKPRGERKPREQRSRREPIVITSGHEVLFDALRRKRKELADAQGVPPYVIFHDTTLSEMAARRPTSLAAMSQVTGVGSRKLDRYGTVFLEVILGHTEPASS